MPLLQYRLKYRQEVAGRRIDNLQYFGGRGLLLQGLARLGDEPRFSIAITACAAKFSTNAICLSQNGLTSRRYTQTAPKSLPSLRSGTLAACEFPVDQASARNTASPVK